MKRHVRKIAGLALATAGAVASWTPAQAHHSFAMYDTDTPVAITGVVVRSNPDAFHYQMFIGQLNEDRTRVLRDASDEPIIWVIEMEGAGQMAAEGVDDVSFPAGTIVSVGFYPLRDGSAGGTRNVFGLYRCPDDTPPAAGQMCDSVDGGQLYGSGELPTEEASLLAS